MRNCSFCGKSEETVRHLLQGGAAQTDPVRPGACICDECIQLCSEILARKASSSRSQEIRPWSPIEVDGRELEWMAASSTVDGKPVMLVIVRLKGAANGPGMIFPQGTVPTEVHAREAARAFKERLT